MTAVVVIALGLIYAALFALSEFEEHRPCARGSVRYTQEPQP